jgi:hypothetical protein
MILLNDMMDTLKNLHSKDKLEQGKFDIIFWDGVIYLI